MITKNAKEDSANKERRSIMCKLTWGESVGLTWWLLAVFIAFIWLINLFFDNYKDGAIVLVIAETVIVSLIWFFVFARETKRNAMKCSCGIIFFKNEESFHKEHG